MLRLFTYLSKNFLVIWLTVVFAFVLLIGILDSLANGGDILADGGTFTDTFKYIFYRAPVIFDRIFVFTIMVAILLVFVRLIRNHELVALLGFGFSVPRQVSLLAPSVLFAAFASITVINLAMPPAVRALQAWGIGEYRVKNITADSPLWLEDGEQIVQAKGRLGYNVLADLKLFKRNETGVVTEIVWADTATFTGENWRLEQVDVLPVEDAFGESRMAETLSGPMTWATQQTPGSIARLAAEPRDLALKDMRNFRMEGNSGSRPSFAYGFWFLHRLTRPLAAFVLLLVAVPIMQRTGREDNGDRALIVGLVTGFIFLIIDGAMATYAVSGGTGVLSAIFFPLILFALAGAFLILQTESLSRHRLF